MTAGQSQVNAAAKADPADALSAPQLEAALRAELGLSIDVVTHQSIDSTNSWSMRQCKATRELPFACFAQMQTEGRGRRGKQWEMVAGSNVAMSLCWSFDVTSVSLDLLPLSIAMAIVATLESFGLDQVQVKWPNDVYVRGQKIAGILIETVPTGQPGVLAVIIGVGLNYDMSCYEGELKQRQGFTDVRRETVASGESIPGFAALAHALLLRLAATCQQYPQSSALVLSAFRDGYDFCQSKYLDIKLDDGRVLQGVAQGVTEQAELCVLVDDELQCFNSADVSIRATA